MRYFNFYFTCLLIFAFSMHTHAQSISSEIFTEEFNSAQIDKVEQVEMSIIAYFDSVKNTAGSKGEITPDDLGVIRRMRASTKTIPLDFNAEVKFYIGKYTSQNWRPYMNRLYSLSQHYFKIYDKVFQEMGLPEEIKYLSLVESSLNPHLVSSAGAVGPWQFIYGTAKIYDLDMNNHIDERKDAYASSVAVSRYLLESYDQFNDWLIALASYNCGRGGMQRAIARSGLKNPNFWELSKFLPSETRRYIPKFVAMTYVLSNASHYGIEVIETELDMDSKIVMLDKTIDLRNVANALGVEISQLKAYNPSFKKDIVQASFEKPRRLFIPQSPTKNDSLLYIALNTNIPVSAPVIHEDVQIASTAKKTKTENYRVKRGETLTAIARKFGVTVQDLRSWNNLSKNSTIAGKNLVVSQPVNTKLAQRVQQASQSKGASKVAYYTVKKGDSLERIASKYKGVTVTKLKADNNLKGNMIKPGMKLKIKTL